MGRIYTSTEELIGRTPLLKLKGEGRILAKLECFNPGGSAKDRVGIAMIEDAEKRGLLAPNALIDLRMCEGIRNEYGEKVVQEMANKLQCRIKAYANQVSPYGTRPAFPRNKHLPLHIRFFVGPGEKIFYPQK